MSFAVVGKFQEDVMTDPIVAYIRFTDGVKRPVCEKASGKQYVVDGNGKKVRGVWHVQLLVPQDLISLQKGLS